MQVQYITFHHKSRNRQSWGRTLLQFDQLLEFINYPAPIEIGLRMFLVYCTYVVRAPTFFRDTKAEYKYG